jgi:hypothetical protein
VTEEEEALHVLAVSYRMGAARHRKRASQIEFGKRGLLAQFMGRSDLNATLIAAHLQAAKAFEEKADALEKLV